MDIFEVANALHDNVASDAISNGQNGQDQVSHLAGNLGLSRISRNGSSVFTVKNQPGWFIFDNGDEAFLVTSGTPALQPISDDLTIADQQADLVLSYSDDILITSEQFAFTRLTTSTVRQLSQTAFIGGVDQLLTLDSQLLPELDFSRFQPSNAVIPPASQHLDFNGPNGLYFQEIFFHIPFLVANALNTNQRFAEAQKWYHYIFNPTRPSSPPQPQRLVGYWPLDEGTGTATLDRAGNNNGTFQGTPTWQTVTDFPGVASRSVIQFSGQGNYVSLPPASFPQGQEITVSFWAFGGASLVPDPTILRSNWRGNQKIALSRGVNDACMFELNFRDERYLPFEGTGAISIWKLRLPRATNRINFDSLSDVIIHLGHTALDAGDGLFTSHVQEKLKPVPGAYYVSFNQAFSSAWYAFMNAAAGQKTQQLKFSIPNEIVPPHITNAMLTAIDFKLDVPDGMPAITGTGFMSLQVAGTAMPAISFTNNYAHVSISPPVGQFAGD